MKKAEIIMLMNAGFTVSEIADLELSNETAQTPAVTAQTPAVTTQTPAVTTQTSVVEPEPTMKDVLAELNKMTNMLAASNIRRDIQPQVPDVTNTLNSLFAKPEVTC